jgi:hypothetical protein
VATSVIANSCRRKTTLFSPIIANLHFALISIIFLIVNKDLLLLENRYQFQDTERSFANQRWSSRVVSLFFFIYSLWTVNVGNFKIFFFYRWIDPSKLIPKLILPSTYWNWLLESNLKWYGITSIRQNMQEPEALLLSNFSQLSSRPVKIILCLSTIWSKTSDSLSLDQSVNSSKTFILIVPSFWDRLIWG